MRRYMVYRIGSNAANQSACQKYALGTVEAKSREMARYHAGLLWGHTCYANQYLDVKAWSRIPRAERDRFELSQAIQAAYRKED